MKLTPNKLKIITLATTITGLSITIPMMVGVLPLWVLTFPLILSCVPIATLFFVEDYEEDEIEHIVKNPLQK